MQSIEQGSFELFVEAGLLHQRAKHRDMAEIEMYITDPQQCKRLQHQPLHFQVAFQPGVTVKLGADLQRLAGAHQSCRLGVQHTAHIAQPRHALAVEQVCVDARHLRRNIGT